MTEPTPPGPDNQSTSTGLQASSVSAPAVITRLQEQQAWYNDHANRARIMYWTIKVIQLVLGASIPVVAGLHAPAAVTGSLGALIVVLEGVQQLFQYHDNWIRYRMAATALAKEGNLFQARAGDYSTGNPLALLAVRTEAITSDEATAWLKTAQAPPSPVSAT
jgi:hypothetical protein